MYNYIGLWTRLIWIFIVCFIGAIVITLMRYKLGLLEKVIAWVLIICMLIFCIINNINSITNPNVKYIEGVFEGEQRRNGLSLFEYEYCFKTENGKNYIEMDILSKKSIYPNDLVVGKTYVVYFEATQNLIVKIIEK